MLADSATADILTGAVEGPGKLPHECLFITANNHRPHISEFVYDDVAGDGETDRQTTNGCQLMRQFTKAIVIAFSFGLLLLCHQHSAAAQGAGAPEAQSLITNARVQKAENVYIGPLYVTIGGKETKIADAVLEAWIIRGGRQVVYSGRDGAGGFEDEGQSLRVYDARTRQHRKIMSEYVSVDTVTEATTKTGKTALLVALVDGGLGASYVAVVNPDRGQVFFRSWAKILSRQGDIIILGHYKEEDWGLDESESSKIKPYRRERQNLNVLLKRRVIYNKRDRP